VKEKQPNKEQKIRDAAEVYNTKLEGASKVYEMMQSDGFAIFLVWLNEQIDESSKLDLTPSVTDENIAARYNRAVGSADALNTVRSQFTVWRTNAKLPLLDNEQKIIQALDQGLLSNPNQD